MKRTRGEGSWERLADGRWLYRVSLGVNDEGKRTRQRFYGRTQQECRQQAEDYRHRLRVGLTPDTQIRLAEYLRDWLSGRAHELRASTIRNYRILIETHIIPALGTLELEELSRVNVNRFVSRMAQNGAAPRTVNYAKTVLGAAMQDAYRDGLVTQNVVRLVRQLPQPRHDISPLSAQEIEALRDAVRGTREEAMYTLALAYGLRQGELLGLCWEDVDFERGLINIRHSLQQNGIVYRLDEPKTETSRRMIVMPPFIADSLRRHQEMQQSEPSDWPQWRALVFREPNGRPYHGPTVTRRFQRLLKDLGIPTRRFHDLRHTCATYLLMSGVDMKVIQVILGHATIAVTANVYAHVLPKMQEDALERMGEILSAQTSGQRPLDRQPVMP